MTKRRKSAGQRAMCAQEAGEGVECGRNKRKEGKKRVREMSSNRGTEKVAIRIESAAPHEAKGAQRGVPKACQRRQTEGNRKEETEMGVNCDGRREKQDEKH
jgi:hypothetical protein